MSTYEKKITWYMREMLPLTPRIKDGVRLLSDPGVEVDWTDKIVQTLYDLASPRLALQYITTTKHQLNTTDDIILRMKLLCNCSREGAFLFQVCFLKRG